MKILDALTEVFFDPGPPPQKREPPPRLDRFGRRIYTAEDLKADRAAFRKSLNRDDY